MKEDADLIFMGKKLRDIRKIKNLSQEQLALNSGLDRSYIGGIERGTRNISIKTLIKISKALECKLESIIGDLPNDK